MKLYESCDLFPIISLVAVIIGIFHPDIPNLWLPLNNSPPVHELRIMDVLTSLILISLSIRKFLHVKSLSSINQK